MRIVFMGTPDFAAAHLQKLLDTGMEVVGVYTQPDKPKGRGMQLAASPVKEIALAAGLPVFQPQTLRDEAEQAQLAALCPDLIAVVAYGKILPRAVLDLPRYGCVNVHASLLPQYRGSAPIQWAVLNGDAITGVTTMYMDTQVDTGDMIYQRETAIGETETSGELFARLRDMGAELLVRTIEDIQAGTAPRTSQDHSRASHTVQLDKSFSPLDWSKPARLVAKQVYGLQPWPVATAEIDGVCLRVFAAAVTERETTSAPGTLLAADKAGLELACGDGKTVLLTEVQAPGKKRMAAADWLRGHPVQVAD